MKKLKLLITLFLFTQISWAQSDILTKRIAVNFKNTPLESALKTIEKEAKLQFSYSSKYVSVDRLVTYQTPNNSVINILDEILGIGLEARVRGNYVILQKRKALEKKDFYVMGYIKDYESGKEINNVSIYEPITLASALSNRYGYYKIKLPSGQKDIGLRFSKESYATETITVTERNDTKINLALNKKLLAKQLTVETKSIETPLDILIKKDSTPLALDKPIEIKHPESTKSVIDTTEKKGLNKIDLNDQKAIISQHYQLGKERFMDWFLSTKQNLHSVNISDSLYRPFQASLLPFIGTNMAMSPFVTNDISLNIIAGYSKNVQKLEIGSLANLVGHNMTGVQLVGGINVVGKEVRGLQMAGGANIVGRQMKGVQLSSGANINLGTSDGLMMATGTNINFKNAKGLNFSGGANITLARFSGVQIAPFNYATRLKGVQIGVFNLAYEAEDGATSIGLFSYVHKNGYRRLEIGSSELNNTEISFKTGTKRFYNVFSTAFNYGVENKPFLGFGYGMGTSKSIGKRFGLNLEGLFSTYLDDKLFYNNHSGYEEDYVSLQLRLSLGLEAKVTKRIALFVAPTLNLFSSGNDNLDFDNYNSKLLLSERDNMEIWQGAKTYSWVGYKFGLRFCNKN